MTHRTCYRNEVSMEHTTSAVFFVYWLGFPYRKREFDIRLSENKFSTLSDIFFKSQAQSGLLLKYLKNFANVFLDVMKYIFKNKNLPLTINGFFFQRS